MFAVADDSSGDPSYDEMARLVGEDEFSLLFHKGKDKNLHFCKINPDLLLMITFDSDLQLGMLRLKIGESVRKIRECWPT